jgi:TctA family transporter
MLGALTVIGLPIGPSLLATDIDVPLTLAATVFLANLIAVPMFLAAVPSIVRLAALRREHMVPFAIALSLFAAAYQDPHWMTVAQFAAGGVVGVSLKWIGWSRAPFLLGFVMGPLAEISYVQTSQIWGWSMFARPASLAMVGVFSILLFRAYRGRSRKQPRRLAHRDALVALPVALLFAVALAYALGLPRNASLVPAIICAAGLLLGALVVLSGVKGGSRGESRHLQKFDGLGVTVAYVALVPLLGLPVASAIYAGALMLRARTGISIALASALCLALFQIWLFSFVVDVAAEPLVTGWVFSALF